MKNAHWLFLFVFIIGAVTFCGCGSKDHKLPILGERQIVNGDTIYHQIPDMVLIDQDSQSFRLSTQADKIVLADFFFTSCPSICPRVKKQMLRLYDKYKTDDRVLFLSYTIDPKHDSTTVLKRYAHNLGVSTINWKFITGEKDSIFTLADSFFVSVTDDPSAPMGFDHSGRIILVDRERHIRGYAEGTDPESVTSFFATIDELLAEQYAK